METFRLHLIVDGIFLEKLDIEIDEELTIRDYIKKVIRTFNENDNNLEALVLQGDGILYYYTDDKIRELGGYSDFMSVTLHPNLIEANNLDNGEKYVNIDIIEKFKETVDKFYTLNNLQHLKQFFKYIINDLDINYHYENSLSVYVENNMLTLTNGTYLAIDRETIDWFDNKVNFAINKFGEEQVSKINSQILKGTNINESKSLNLSQRKFNTAEREKLAKSGKALPDGSYPIVNKDDLHNAISTYGLGKNHAKAKRHIIKRAKALGATDIIPEDWPGSTKGDKSDKSQSINRWEDSASVVTMTQKEVYPYFRNDSNTPDDKIEGTKLNPHDLGKNFLTKTFGG